MKLVEGTTDDQSWLRIELSDEDLLMLDAGNTLSGMESRGIAITVAPAIADEVIPA